MLEKKESKKLTRLLTVTAFYVVLLVCFSFTSHFGQPNPVAAGLLSSLAVGFLLLALIIILANLMPLPWALLGFFLVSVLYILITSANWWHFQYFQVYFNFEYLPFARDAGSALVALEAYGYTLQTIILCLLFLLAAVMLVLWKKASLKPRSIFLHWILALTMGVTTLLMANSKVSAMKEVNTFTLSPFVFHPLHAFFYPIATYSGVSEEGWFALKQFNKQDFTSPLLPSVPDAKRYNVIVLTMESFSASFIGAYNSGSKLTPYFDAMAQHGILFNNFYANSNYTLKGENALICGIFDHNAKLTISEYSAEKHLSCLPKLLGGVGYNTYYFHANYGRFYNRQNYLSKIGFQNLHFHADKFPERGDEGLYIGWGLSDADMFRVSMEELASDDSGEPFYAHIMSISAHYPFAFDWPIEVPNPEATSLRLDQNRIYLNYENAIQYSDYAIGAFWKEFKKSPFFENTILIVTSDHGVWVFDQERDFDLLAKNEQFFRMPLFIYHPDINSSHSVDQISSQVDVPVTILDLLGVEFDRNYFVGKNLIYQVENPWAVMMKGGELAIRLDNKMCVPRDLSCNRVYQSCWSQTAMDSVFLPESYGSMQCFEWHNDLLNGGGSRLLLESSVGDKIVGHAYGMIGFENRRVFESGFSSVISAPTRPTLNQFAQQLAREQKVEKDIELEN